MGRAVILGRAGGEEPHKCKPRFVEACRTNCSGEVLVRQRRARDGTSEHIRMGGESVLEL